MPGMAKALAALMAGKTDAYVKGVQGATDALAAQLSASSVEGIRKVFAEHAGQLQSLKSGMWYAAAIGGSFGPGQCSGVRTAGGAVMMATDAGFRETLAYNCGPLFRMP